MDTFSLYLTSHLCCISQDWKLSLRKIYLLSFHDTPIAWDFYSLNCKLNKMSNCHYVPYLYFSIFKTKMFTICSFDFWITLFKAQDWLANVQTIHSSQYLDFILDHTTHAGLVASIMVSHGTLLSKSCFDIMASSVIMGSKSSSPIIPISRYDIGNITEEIIPNISQWYSF